MAAPPRRDAVKGPATRAVPPEAAPTTGSWGGAIGGDRAAGYEGGAICPEPACPSVFRFTGRHVPAEQAVGGAHVALDCGELADGPDCVPNGVRFEAVLTAGGSLRWRCPRCREQRKLVLEVSTPEPDFRGVFLRPRQGGDGMGIPRGMPDLAGADGGGTPRDTAPQDEPPPPPKTGGLLDVAREVMRGQRRPPPPPMQERRT